ncbi:MAG: DNA polymerase III subunit alpha [Bacteroidia bacterium]|nr:DNA polymerase III subunit alpha [Bacteroidia bacterium]
MWLNCHTFYSLKYGTLSVEQLLQLAAQHGAGTVVVTDINNSTGVLECLHYCKENKLDLKVLAGIEFRCKEAFNYLYTGIAKNHHGFSFLNEFLTEHNLSGKPLPARPPQSEHVYWIYRLKSFPANLKEKEFVGASLNDILRLYKYKGLEEKLLFFHPVSFEKAEHFEVHKHLRAISFNTLISKLSPEQHAFKNEFFIDKSALEKRLEGYEFLLQNAEALISDCSFDFEFKGNKNKKLFTKSAEADTWLLKRLAYSGLEKRYGTNVPNAKTRIDHELKIINDMGFASYFLITWDIVRFSMSQNIYHVGRGSGANSVVAYCLKITDVDPIELDLYFERFLNPERSVPPDFDIDYCWKDRDTVLDYVFKKYGKKHTALLGTVTNFKDRSVIRELGKVFGLPKQQIEVLVNLPEEKIKTILNREKDRERNHNKTEEEKELQISTMIFKIAESIQRTPNYRSIHAGGILISELPLSYYTALDLPPKGYPTVQWDMHTAEEIGFEKLDILSQRGIGHINDATKLIQKNQGIALDIHDIKRFKEDLKVKAHLKNGDTIGCFYVESPAMRGLLRKLKCDTYIMLTAASSIIRPGVASSGMMKEFIRRFHDQENIQYAHPIMEEQLKETFGVMIYQEDVLKIGHHYGGLNLAEADMLRRLMSGKKRGVQHLITIKKKFFENCKAKGYDETVSETIWYQMESFAGFSFSKAHSASYAVESYQSLYLKAHYPLEFIVAVINNFGGFYRTWVYIYEAKKLGGIVHLPCVNNSENLTTLYGKEIYLGFIHVKSLEKNTVERIIKERQEGGIYKDFSDLVSRTQIKLEQLLLLIKSGSCRIFNNNKKTLYWNSYYILGKETGKPESTLKMFSEPAKQFFLPKLAGSFVEDLFDELALFGFPITNNFYSLIKTPFRGDLLTKALIDHIGKTVRLMGNFVNERVVYTKKGERMAFGTFIDAVGDLFDTVHFPDVYSKFRFEGIGIYLIEGVVIEEFGFPMLEVKRMGKVKIMNQDDAVGLLAQSPNKTFLGPYVPAYNT